MARPRLQDYTKLIVQKAWATWRKLPPQHKNWIDVDDLIQDGLLFARFQALPHYRPHRAKFSLFLGFSLENFYKEKLFKLFTAKRNGCQVVPVGSVSYSLGKCTTTAQELKAIRGLTRIINEASPVLRHYLHHWLFSREKLRCHGKRFEVARDEMRGLAEKCGFDHEDLRYLLYNESWRRELQPTQLRCLPRND